MLPFTQENDSINKLINKYTASLSSYEPTVILCCVKHKNILVWNM